MKHHVLLCIKDFRSGIEKNKDGRPFKSGAEFHAERHAQELVRQGHTVTVFAKKRRWHMASYEFLEGFALHRLFPVIRGLLLIYLLLTKYRQATVLHLLGKPDFAAFAVPVAQRLGIAVSLEITIAGEIFNKKASLKLLERLQEKMFRRCDRFIANSHEMVDGLLAGGVPAERIVQHPQGIDIERFSPLDNEQKVKMRQSLGLPENTTLVLFCCRIVQRKGIDLLLAAWQQLGQACEAAQLVIVGGGEGQWIERVLALTQRDKRVHYHGEVPDPVPYYQACDIYVFPSRQEGLPTSVMEAMGCGLAPVVSAIGGNLDLVSEKVGTGLVCLAEDVDSLADYMEKLIVDKELCSKIGEAARQYAVRQLDRRRLVAELADIFTNMQRKRMSR